jgi:hypothetical protein
MSHFQPQVDIVFEAIHLQGENRTIGEMVIQGADGGKIDRGNEQLHSGYPFQQQCRGI